MHVIIAGDSGVYYGKLIGEVGSGGVARLEGARHLRRYYVAGRQGDGYGSGSGDGYGDGSGDGYGSGDGDGYGF